MTNRCVLIGHDVDGWRGRGPRPEDGVFLCRQCGRPVGADALDGPCLVVPGPLEFLPGKPAVRTSVSEPAA